MQNIRGAKIASFGLVAMLGLAVPEAHADENSVSNIPVGLATVLPGITPGPEFDYLQYNTLYVADRLNDARGNKAVPDFHLEAAVVAPRFDHVWGKVGGIEISSFVAQPILLRLKTRIDTGQGVIRGSNSGFADTIIAPATFGIKGQAPIVGAYFITMGPLFIVPTGKYNKNAVINPGANRTSFLPFLGLSFFPTQKLSVGAQITYTYNWKNTATDYKSGQEINVDYGFGYQIAPKVSLQANGYYFKQFTDDRINGIVFNDGNKGEAFAIGPQVVVSTGRGGFSLKYQKEVMARNRPQGQRFWVQWIVNFPKKGPS